MSRRHRKLDARRWTRTRLAVLDRDGWRCCECGRAGRLEVDHAKALEDDPGQDAYAVEGCQALCRGCHARKTRAENLARRGARMTPGEIAWRALVEELKPA